jgi:hypothetical protein
MEAVKFAKQNEIPALGVHIAVFVNHDGFVPMFFYTVTKVDEAEKTFSMSHEAFGTVDDIPFESLGFDALVTGSITLIEGTDGAPSASQMQSEQRAFQAALD